jgi:hypothetical protein
LTGLLLAFGVVLGDGVEAVVAATCEGVGFSGADGAVCGGAAGELQAAAADTRATALATAKTLRRKRTRASTSPTIAPSFETNALMFFESRSQLLITQQLSRR